MLTFLQNLFLKVVKPNHEAQRLKDFLSVIRYSGFVFSFLSDIYDSKAKCKPKILLVSKFKKQKRCLLYYTTPQKMLPHLAVQSFQPQESHLTSQDSLNVVMPSTMFMFFSCKTWQKNLNFFFMPFAPTHPNCP